MTKLIDVIKHCYFLGHGVEYFMRKAIDQLYQRFGVYEGSNKYPTFVDVEQLLVKEYVRGREMLWMSSAKRAVASLTFKGLLREVLNVQQNTNIDELLKDNVIIEMDNLATLEKTFIVESLMLWLYHFKKTQGKSEKLNHVTVVEEALHNRRCAGAEKVDNYIKIIKKRIDQLESGTLKYRSMRELITSKQNNATHSIRKPLKNIQPTNSQDLSQETENANR